MTLVPITIAKRNNKNPQNDPNTYLILDIFLLVIILYRLATRNPIPKNVSNPKNRIENVCNNVLVVAGSNPTVDNWVGFFIKLKNIADNPPTTIINNIPHPIATVLSEILDFGVTIFADCGGRTGACTGT